MKAENKETSVLEIFGRKMFAGGGAGAISRTLTAPVERVKVVLQVQSVSNVPEHLKFKGIKDCFFGIYKKQGIVGYWRGNGINVLRIVPNSAIKFATFDFYKRVAFPKGEKNYESREKFVRKMLCGGLAGASTMIPVYPLDFARTKLSADTTSKYRGIRHLMSSTISTHGVKGLYSGLSVSLFGIIPYLAVSLTTYDTLKELAGDKSEFNSLPGRICLGSIAAIISQAMAYPVDTVRRHMQVSGGLGQRAKYNSVRECLKEIYSKNGVRGFYKGLFINVARAAPQTGIEFAAFDYLSALIRENR